MSTVAFDASTIFGKGGIQTYARELISHLAVITARPDLLLLTRGSRIEEIEQLLTGTETVRVIGSMPHPLMLGKHLRTITDLIKTLTWARHRAEFDLVHFHEASLHRPVRGRVVVTIHDLFPLDPEIPAPAPLRRSFEQQVDAAVERADRIIVPSEYVAGTIAERYPDKAEIVRVTHLAASDRFVPSDLERPIEEPYLIWIGRLDGRKNLERILEAWRDLPAPLRRSHRFVLIGPWSAADTSNYSSELSSLLEQPGIVLRNSVSAAEHRQLLTHATALIFPSLAEGFGLPIIEAMKCGCPVLTSNTTSMKEIATDASVMVDPRSASEIRLAMEELMTDAELRRSLKERGHHRAATFSWERTAQQTLQVYNEVLP